MILESIVTSVDRAGRVNLAPMGPTVRAEGTADAAQPPSFLLRPFVSSRTYQNLVHTRAAVIHVTDDAMLFAKAAVDAIDDDQVQRLVRRIDQTDWWPLQDCHRWFAVEVESIGGDDVRADMPCRVIRSGVVRPFFGFNRAKHAVLEAAILATRTHLLPPAEIQAEMTRLRPLIDKTAGPVEHDAFDFLQKIIDERLARQ